MKNKVIHIVLNTFEYDSRVIKECKTLADLGLDVIVIAYHRKGLKYVEYSNGFKIIRLPLITINFSNNPIIQVFKYFEFFIKATFTILKVRPSICHGHDPSGLFVAYFSKIVLKTYLIYDSHELWGHTSHMKNYNRILYKFGGYFEKKIMRSCNAIITVNKSIAEKIKNNSLVEDIHIIRNIPEYQNRKTNYTRDYLQLPNAKKIIIYVGSIAKGRGIEKLIYLMKKIDKDIALAILGVEEKYKLDYEKYVFDNQLSSRIKFLDRVSPEDVVNVSSFADLGIHPVENTCLNNYYCLPNKIFQYMHAGLPVVCSDFPEMKNIIENYGVGEVFNVDNIDDIVCSVNNVLCNSKKMEEYKKKSIKASKLLNWKNEEKILINIYRKYINDIYN